MAYTRNAQTVPDDSPGGNTVRQGIAEQNSVAINDLYTALNEHATGTLSHTEIEDAIANVSGVDAARVACEGYRDECETLAEESASSAATALAAAQNPASHVHTPSQVGLSNIPNAKSDSISTASSTTLATSTAAKSAYDRGSLGVTNAATAATAASTAQSRADSAYSLAAAAVPAGSIIAWVSANTAPAGYLLCNGATFSSASYPALYNALWTTTLPDLRGVALRGLDDGRGLDGGRGINTYQADDFMSHTHTYSKASGQAAGAQSGSAYTLLTGATTGATGGTETRMKNVAVRFYIKY